jgi:hypothetical protein
LLESFLPFVFQVFGPHSFEPRVFRRKLLRRSTAALICSGVASIFYFRWSALDFA